LVSQPAIEQLSYTERVLSDLSVADLQDELGERLLRGALASGDVPVGSLGPAFGVCSNVDRKRPAVVVELFQGARRAASPDVAFVALT
jgi:hypothetical protein